MTLLWFFEASVTLKRSLVKTSWHSRVTLFFLFKRSIKGSVKRVSWVIALCVSCCNVSLRKINVLMSSKSTALKNCPVRIKKIVIARHIVSWKPSCKTMICISWINLCLSCFSCKHICNLLSIWPSIWQFLRLKQLIFRRENWLLRAN